MTIDNSVPRETAEEHRSFLRQLTRNWPRSLPKCEPRLPTFEELTMRVTQNALELPLLIDIYQAPLNPRRHRR